MKTSRWVIPGVAGVLLAFSVKHMVFAAPKHELLQAPENTPRPELESAVAGIGTVEPAGQSVRLGVHRQGVVASVAVQVGGQVAKDTELFCIDSRAAEAEVAVREQELLMARAELGRLRSLPRKSAILPLRARMQAAAARLTRAEDNDQRTQELVQQGAAPTEQSVVTHTSSLEAQHARDLAAAELALAEEGAWAPELGIAGAQVATAEALLKRAKTELALHCVKAPFAARVLKVDVRVGEYVGPSGLAGEVVVGRDAPPEVRAEFDQVDIARWARGKGAVAIFRGTPQLRAKLKLLRVEPIVVPKKTFTGGSLERVDTRVLEAVYSFEEAPEGVHVGQQLDVFVASEHPESTSMP